MSLNFYILIMFTNFLALNALAQKYSSPIIQKKIYELTKDFKVPGLTHDQIKDTKDYHFLDARKMEEFNISHIKNAIYVGYNDFKLKEVIKKINKNKKIIVYCSLGYRSGEIAQKLKEQGYEVYNLLGGLFEWSNNGKPIYDNQNNKTNKIHGYNKQWSRWITKGEIELD